METNSYSIKLTGKAELPEPITLSNNYKVELEGGIISEARHDNDDGSFSVVYTFKPARVVGIDDEGKRLKAKDPRRNSEKIRSTFHWVWRQKELAIDPDEFYTKCTNIIIKNATIIAEEALGDSKTSR